MSFASATAHYDIYGHGARSKGVFVKSEFYGTTDRMSGLLTLRDPKLHAARRKNLAPGFSARALREQTEMVMEYVDLFVKRLDEHSKSGPVEIGRWLNWLTFDIIGTLVFSEPFGAVDQGNI